jgi:competence protein ComEC
MRYWRQSFTFLALILGLSILGISSFPDAKLHLVACDVGQGDAILASYKNIQILVDGGPDEDVLECLAKYLPFWDREIELVVLTHPQLDHYGGLTEVFQRYQVDTFLTNEAESGSLSYQALRKAVGGSGVRVIHPKDNQVIRIGLLYLDILHPSEFSDGGNWSDINELSIVANLRFGEFEALLTGDIPPSEIDKLLAAGKITDVEYIKVPHHGSRNGLTHALIEASSPEIAVISVGAKNSYGHPHAEILRMLNERGIRTLRTDEEGDIEVVSDGNRFWLAN